MNTQLPFTGSASRNGPALPARAVCWPALLALAHALWSAPAQATTNYLFSNLQLFGERPDVGNPSVVNKEDEGPKGLATTDFDGDGRADVAVANFDGSVTVYFGNGDGTLSGPLYLQGGLSSTGLRGIVTA